MKALNVVLFTLLAASFTSAQSVRVGTLTYQPGQGDTSGYYVSLDSTEVAAPLTFGSIVLYIRGKSQASGPISGPVKLLYMGGADPAKSIWPLPSCIDGCVSISVQLLSPDGKAMTFRRTNGGKTFTTFGINTTTMQPLPGRTSIVPGQSVGIYLMPDPKAP